MKKLGNFLVQAQRILGVIMALLAAVIIVAQVFLRYVLKMPLMGIEEALTFFTIWLYMLGAANASQFNNHIECGILTLYIKTERSNLIYEFVKSLLCTAIGVWITYWMYVYLIYCYQKWQLSALLKIPMFIGQSALFVGILLMFIFSLRDLYISGRNLTAYFHRAPEKEDSI